MYYANIMFCSSTEYGALGLPSHCMRVWLTHIQKELTDYLQTFNTNTCMYAHLKIKIICTKRFNGPVQSTLYTNFHMQSGTVSMNVADCLWLYVTV